MPIQLLRTTGFSLLEVLVALFVLSLGLLGLAALQTTAFRFNGQSYQRTQATIQAYDILDRIRANPAGKNGGLYDGIAMGYLPSSPPDCLYNPPTNTPCDETQMASYDIFQWNTANANLLSNGAGSVSTDATTRIRTVTIQWVENDIQMQLVVQAQL